MQAQSGSSLIGATHISTQHFMSPRDVLDLWIARFNAADVDGIAEIYAEHAVNHQVALEPAEGKEAIRRMFAREFPTLLITDGHRTRIISKFLTCFVRAENQFSLARAEYIAAGRQKSEFLTVAELAGQSEQGTWQA